MKDDHRVYSYLSEPVRIFGLTLDEIVIGLGGFSFCLLATSLTIKSLGIAIGIGGVWLLKRLKKATQGFSLKSFLNWKLGIRFGVDDHWPKSAYKGWLS